MGELIGMPTRYCRHPDSPFDELLHHPAARLVVISPNHELNDFLVAVEEMGLQRVSYAIGWSAWLDLAGNGVNKATAMERIRLDLGIPRSRVVAVVDGHNDLELLTWASEHGRGVALGQAPSHVISVASELMRRQHGGRRARVRGAVKVAADFSLSAAAVNLARLGVLGITRTTRAGWSVATA